MAVTLLEIMVVVLVLVMGLVIGPKLIRAVIDMTPQWQMMLLVTAPATTCDGGGHTPS